MFKYAIAFILALASTAKADTITTNYGFDIPIVGTVGWGNKVSDWAIKLDTGAAGVKFSNTFTSSQTISDSNGGGLLVKGDSVTASAFFGDASHMTGISASFSGGGVANATTFFSSTTIKDGTAGGLLVVGDSVTASAFFGDGSHLTGVSGSGGEQNTYTSSKTFTNQVQISAPAELVVVSSAQIGNTYLYPSSATVSNILGVNGGSGTPIVASWSTTSGSNALMTLTNTASGGSVSQGYATYKASFTNTGNGNYARGFDVNTAGTDVAYIGSDGSGYFAQTLTDATSIKSGQFLDSTGSSGMILSQTTNNIYSNGNLIEAIGSAGNAGFTYGVTAGTVTAGGNTGVLLQGSAGGDGVHVGGNGSSAYVGFYPNGLNGTRSGYIGNVAGVLTVGAESTNINLTGGNVGINTASPSSYAGFSPIVASSGTNGAFQVTGGNGKSWSIGSQGAGMGIYDDNAGGAYRFFVSNAGNVGVGTSSPNAANTLEVNGISASSGTVGEFRAYAQNANTAIVDLQSGNGHEWQIGSAGTGYGAPGKLIFYDVTASKERANIDTAGNFNSDQNVTANNGIFSYNVAAASACFGIAGNVSTFTATGSLVMSTGATVNLYGSAGTITSVSSITASAFFGDGSHLSGVSGSGFTGGGVANATTFFSSVTVSGATVAVTQNGASANSNLFPNSPIQAYGNTNTYLQSIIQNLNAGNNASSDYVATSNNGTDSTYYADFGINSSAFSQATQTVFKTTSSYLYSSDGDMVIGSNFNAGVSSGSIIFFTSAPVTGNIRAYFDGTSGAFVSNSSFTINGAATNGMLINGTGALVPAIKTSGSSAVGMQFSNGSWNDYFEQEYPGSGGNLFTGSLAGAMTLYGGSPSFQVAPGQTLNMTMYGKSVGFGTSSPLAQLDVRSSTGTAQYVLMASSQNATAMFSVTGNGSVVIASTETIQGNAFSVGGSTMVVSGGTVTFGASTPVYFSSSVYTGVSISTIAAGSAGSLVTVSCPAQTFAMSGGCSCTGAVAATGDINMPYPTLTVPGSMPTGWQCQETGTTGGACAAFVLCSRIRF